MGKLLTILGVNEEQQKKLPSDVFKAEKLIDSLQQVYAESPESIKKNQLASAISESVRILMAKVNPYLVDTQKEEKIKKEEEKLPEEDNKPKEMPKDLPKAPKDQTNPPKAGPPPPAKPESPKPPPPEPPQREEEEPMTCEEIKSAIKGLNLLVKMGDDEAKEIVKSLKNKLKQQNC
jgi:type IV secretory pathway VirB10-like protein